MEVYVIFYKGLLINWADGRTPITTITDRPFLRSSQTHEYYQSNGNHWGTRPDHYQKVSNMSPDHTIVAIFVRIPSDSHSEPLPSPDLSLIHISEPTRRT